MQRLRKFFIVVPSILCASVLFAGTAEAKVATTELSLDGIHPVTQELGTPATGIAVAIGTGTQQIELQVKEDGEWSEWKTIRIDNDAFAWERNSDLLMVDDATAVHLQSASPTVVTLFAVNVNPAPTSWEEAAGRKLVAPVIVPRWQWGADESLRVSKRGAQEVRRIFDEYDPFLADRIHNCDRRAFLYPEEFQEVNRVYTDEDGNTLIWPQGYSRNIDAIVVHHTTGEATSGGRRKSDIEWMQAIYEYHTIGRGWGDIGYNFVIGPNGTIFEGRAGGDYVVGAHAYCNNVGTMGVSLMGNFQNGIPTEEQEIALKWLLVYLTDKYHIDPTGRTIHHGKTMPTIIGHRDVGQTACPGTFAYELLPQFRLAAKERDVGTPLFSSVAEASSKNEAALMESLQPVEVPMGGNATETVRYMNVGLDTWNKDTWLLAESDEAGVYFTEFKPFSYVAGFMNEETVRPGEIATFTVKLQGGLSSKKGGVILTPVINNNRRLINNTAYFAYTVREGNARFTPVTQYFPNLHKVGEDLTGTVKIVNSGSVPWERNTITEIVFDVDGGRGDASVLEHPQIVKPGEQGSFRVRLHDIDELGAYQRTLTPRFLEGSSLVGDSVVVKSNAEPIPDIALISNNAGPPSLIAEARLMAAAGHSTAPVSATLRQPYTESEGVLIEALAGTDITLSPREQASIPLRIRAGKDGVAQFQPIAEIVRSNPTIVLVGENHSRMRNTYRSPASLRRYQTYETEVGLIAPRNAGEYTFSIGNIAFQLTVKPNARYTLRESAAPRILTRRSTLQILEDRSRERRLRRTITAPPTIEKNEEDTYIRIKLDYDKSDTILTSHSQLRIEGAGNIIFVDGPVHLNMNQGLCKVTTGNGQFQSPVIRIFPNTNERSYTTIMTLAKSANRFRGTLECRVINGKLTLINELTMEDYLAGLAEEPDSEPYEKQRAFAIAARSYATFYVVSGQRKFPGMPYDGSDNPAEFQKYGGVYFEEQNPRWVDAVKSTEDEVITWERQVVKAPYFSSDSGQTKSAFDVWGWTNTPYLESKPDPWCAGMQNWGHGVGMSGCGAEGQANEGKTAEEILGYYYPGTRILPISSIRE